MRNSPSNLLHGGEEAALSSVCLCGQSQSGIKESRQRYTCNACPYFFTVSHQSDTATSAQRRVALNLYWEGLDVRAIGRLLGFSHVAVYQWSKVFGQAAAQIKRPAPTSSN